MYLSKIPNKFAKRNEKRPCRIVFMAKKGGVYMGVISGGMPIKVTVFNGAQKSKVKSICSWVLIR